MGRRKVKILFVDLNGIGIKIIFHGAVLEKRKKPCLKVKESCIFLMLKIKKIHGGSMNSILDDLSSSEKAEFQRQYDILSSFVVEVTPEDEFKKMLKHSIQTKTPLRVKCGIDPTRSDVHLGHLVPYKKMRQFQDLGHTGVVVIGDYTAQIGDPSGKTTTRAALAQKDVQENARKYMDQLYSVLDKSKTEVRFQSEWFEKITLADILTWAMQTSANKLLTHDTFKKRLEDNLPLALHELFYPMLQGVDSVFIKADVELGGSDQRFNVLMGRDYQRHQKMRPQVAILLPLVLGTCGKEKMSKSLDNYIALHMSAKEQFGKVMSIPDDLMPDYYRYFSSLSIGEIESIVGAIKSDAIHPNLAKKDLAENIVSFFHGAEEGKLAREEFEKVFRDKGLPTDIVELKEAVGERLVDVLAVLGMSKSEIRRLMTQNAVSFYEGDKITDANKNVEAADVGKIIKIGKRKFVKIVS